MSVVQFTKLVEAIGVPAVVAAGLGWLLWKLLQYILKDLRSDMLTQHSELEQTLRVSRTILIQLVDRVRVLERNIYRHQDATAVKLGIAAPQYDITRKERHDEAQQILADVGKINGD